ncbi:EH domain-containing protein 3-like [Artemia franciscana]
MDKILPVEEKYLFRYFYPAFTGNSFEDKPMVLLVGQNSTMKRNFIKFLLRKDAPHLTSDKFMAFIHGDNEKIMYGNSIFFGQSKRFEPLSNIRGGLSYFQCCSVNAPVLENLTIVDTPGILCNDKRSWDCDYSAGLEWLAEQADSIFWFFDNKNMDIPDVFRALSPHSEKIKITISSHGMFIKKNESLLMAITGRIFWKLGKLLDDPIAPSVFYWDECEKLSKPKELFDDVKNEAEKLSETEGVDLLSICEEDEHTVEERKIEYFLLSIVKNTEERKIKAFVKRAELVKTHMLFIDEVMEDFPKLCKMDTEKKVRIKLIEEVYRKIMTEQNTVKKDFLEKTRMQEKLRKLDFKSLPKKKEKELLKKLNSALSEDIPQLMRMLEDSTSKK